MIKFNKDFLAGVVVGFGAGLATRALPAETDQSLREAAKGAMKWTLTAADAAKTRLAQLKETIQDLAAEAKAEVSFSQTPSVVEEVPTRRPRRSKQHEA